MKPNYHLENLSVVKTLFFSFALSVVLCSCESGARKSKTIPLPKANLVAINPRPPLDPVEAKRYHDLIEDFISKNLSEKYFSGGILVAKNGVPVYERYTGFSNWKTKDSITPETPLQVASTGKTLTSAAVLKLVQEGKLGLNDLVT